MSANLSIWRLSAPPAEVITKPQRGGAADRDLLQPLRRQDHGDRDTPAPKHRKTLVALGWCYSSLTVTG